MFAIALASIAMAQAGADQIPPWEDEHRLAVHASPRISTDPADCLERQDNRLFLAEAFRGQGLAAGPRSGERRGVIRLVSLPERNLDRITYHYLSLGASTCFPASVPSYPCLSIYVARIEMPVTADGRPEPNRALNDPDRTTVALLEAARALARRCGHVAGDEASAGGGAR